MIFKYVLRRPSFKSRAQSVEYTVFESRDCRQISSLNMYQLMAAFFLPFSETHLTLLKFHETSETREI